MNTTDKISKIIEVSIEESKKNNSLPKFDSKKIIIEKPKNKSFGNWSTNIALTLSKELKKNPVEIAEIIKSNLTAAGFEVFGATNAPYAWMKTPKNMSSWDFFDFLLENANVVGTPGSGFGAAGEGYFRLSAFNSRENVEKAMQRIIKL